MDQAAKLERKKSTETLIKKKPETRKKSNPRNPLKDLNSISSEAPRKSCFSFLMSSSSSKTSLPRSTKSLAKTPNSAPPNPRVLSSKTPSNPRSRNTPKTSSENPRRVPPQNPQKSNLLLAQHVKKPSLGGSSRNTDTSRHHSSTGKLSELSYQEVLNGHRNSVTFEPCLASSPEEKMHLGGFASELALDFESTPEKGGEKQNSTTPTATTTPPVQASISPEIICGSSVVSTPACFAAGHVIAGVQDRRKCRPRGILNVNGFALGIPGDRCGNKSRVSMASPPLTGASIHWLSSPGDNADGGITSSSSSRFHLADFPGEASVNWLLSPCGDVKGDDLENELVGIDTSGLESITSSGHGLWRISPPPAADATVSIEKSTPSTGHVVWKTPTTEGSVSPFSMILRRAAASSGLKVLDPQERLEGYRCGLVLENSPFSGESWGNRNVICTPSSHSSSENQAGSSSKFEMKSVASVLQTLSSTFPQKPGLTHNKRDVTQLSALSFHFGCPATPSNSIDLIQHEKNSGVGISRTRKECLSGSEMRISWRDGLISRIFEMDELNHCQLLSEEEEYVDCHGEDELNSKLDIKFNRNIDSSMLTDGFDHPLTSGGFGSFEFVCDRQGDKKNVANVPPLRSASCAESINIEGGELISSGDSDWTLFYKNHLFEIRKFGMLW